MTALSLFRTPPPDVTVEVSSRRVSAVALSGDARGLHVTAHAVEPLAPGAVVPALNASNIAVPDAVAAAVRAVFERLGRRPGRVALVVPDAVAKVSFVRFASVPPKVADLDEMVRFQVRKAAPFRIDDATVAHAPGLADSAGREFIVTQARTDIVAEYERACAAGGAHAGLVGLATFNVINAALSVDPSAAGDWLVIHAQDETASIAILRERHLVFFRHRGADAGGPMTDLVHQTAMYYQDRLAGPGFARVAVVGPGLDAPGVVADLERRLGTGVRALDLSSVVRFADRPTPTKSLIDTLTPALGLALASKA